MRAESCWATPVSPGFVLAFSKFYVKNNQKKIKSESPADQRRYTFLDDGCQTAEENSESFEIFENGASFEVRFSISTFAFRQSETKSIFLHYGKILKFQNFFSYFYVVDGAVR